MPNGDADKQMRPPMTQREALAGRRHGDFARALYEAATSGDVWKLVEAFGRADEHNQATLARVFPGARSILSTLYNHWPMRGMWLRVLAQAFPRHLGGDLDGPARFDEAQTVVVQHGEVNGANMIELVREPAPVVNIEAAHGGDEVEG